MVSPESLESQLQLSPKDFAATSLSLYYLCPIVMQYTCLVVGQHEGANVPTLADMIAKPPPPGDLRKLRVKLMKQLRAKTGRYVLIIAADPNKVLPPPGAGLLAMLHLEDIQMFGQVMNSVPKGASVDVIVNSAGGIAEVAEKISKLLRDRFESVRFLVPDIAQSAATILVLSGQALAMRPLASLGPIDPQFAGGDRSYAAQDLLNGVDRILKQSQGGKLNPGYIPILQKVNPAELQAAENANQLSTSIVETALATGMLADKADAAKKATGIAEAMCDRDRWLSHGRLISLDDLRDLGLPVEDYTDLEYGHLIDDLWNALFMGLQSNLIKIYESETVDLGKRVNVSLAPAGPPGGLPIPPEQIRDADADYQCPKCGNMIPLHLRFDKRVPPKKGRIRFPKNNHLRCSRCSADLDLSQMRRDVEARTGKRVLD